MGKANSAWKYASFLPIPKGDIITIGEGNTPLLQSKKQANIYYKCDFQNPTGSFKDRGSTVEISHAKADGYTKVVCASTGNMGASISAYAARAGIEATICVPSHVPQNKLNQIKSYGAELLQVKGGYNDALKKTWEIAGKNRKVMCTGDYPLRMEGQKTMAFEIVEQLGMKSPAQIIAPIGNGTLLASLHAGFNQMIHKKWVKHMPRIIGVQAENCAPLLHAWKKKTTHFEPIRNAKTIAGAIECGNPVYGIEALQVVRQTNGKILGISEQHMKKAKQTLASREGLYVEYSGAAVHAAVEEQKWNGITVAVLGGHGLKE